MKLLFKQRMFSWFDSYDIYNEAGDAVYEVKGVLSWGHCLKIFGPDGAELGTVKEEVFSFLPRFALYVGGECVGQIKKEFTFFKPVFTLDCSGWSIEGDLWEWNYLVSDADGRHGNDRAEGITELDGHLRAGHCRQRRRTVLPDGGAGHRRRQMLAERLTACIQK